MTHRWHWRKYQPDRKDEPCRLICAGGGSVLVEFADGHQVIAPRYAIRRLEVSR